MSPSIALSNLSTFIFHQHIIFIWVVSHLGIDIGSINLCMMTTLVEISSWLWVFVESCGCLTIGNTSLNIGSVYPWTELSRNTTHTKIILFPITQEETGWLTIWYLKSSRWQSKIGWNCSNNMSKVRILLNRWRNVARTKIVLIQINTNHHYQ